MSEVKEFANKEVPLSFSFGLREGEDTIDYAVDHSVLDRDSKSAMKLTVVLDEPHYKFAYSVSGPNVWQFNLNLDLDIASIVLIESSAKWEQASATVYQSKCKQIAVHPELWRK
ncbi:hypothetical protein C0029_06790 [Halioglobus japonicus]|uniref:Uncharacterized protein n=1 Tax=Halioglobus japonicus TaxID=930805 RepID=A0AAP8SN07_9GAMM|nr:hypothetical protein C0029_06790 [Halioglobus japonicus]